MIVTEIVFATAQLSKMCVPAGIPDVLPSPKSQVNIRLLGGALSIDIEAS